VREALSSALVARGAIAGARVLDLFAGSGALAFEALSRGATEAVLVDRDSRCIQILDKNASDLGLSEQVRLLRLDLLTGKAASQIAAPRGGFDLLFADAPYASSRAIPPLLEALAEQGKLSPGAWVAVEHDAKLEWSWPEALASVANYRYGQTAISLAVFEAKENHP
jgi:16S rRNA (guanine966-N2)-methyltransferase